MREGCGKDVPMTGKEGKTTAGRRKARYVVSEVEELERLSLAKANRVISAIESAMAVWDASGDRPPKLRPRVSRLRCLHERLSGWERGMLRARGESLEARVARLREFGAICNTYFCR